MLCPPRCVILHLVENIMRGVEYQNSANFKFECMNNSSLSETQEAKCEWFSMTAIDLSRLF